MQLVSSGRGCFLKDSKVKMADKSFKNIQDIKKGDSVISHDGSNNIILDLFKYSVSEEIIKIELEDGRIIQCTKEHKILTKNGWKEAEKLNENDEIVEI
jgi:intein/homing endonuclease